MADRSVITGRVVDSALALGPLIKEFGWGPADLDQLAGGTLAGHLIECGAQVTGGTYTDWRDVHGWEDIGAPIAECFGDGSCIITKFCAQLGYENTQVMGVMFVTRPPELAHEGVGVFQPDDALRRLADVGDDILRVDRILAYQLGERRGAGRLGFEKDAGPAPLEESNAPAVGMHVGGAAARLEAGEGKADVGRNIAVHAE